MYSHKESRHFHFFTTAIIRSSAKVYECMFEPHSTALFNQEPHYSPWEQICTATAAYKCKAYHHNMSHDVYANAFNSIQFNTLILPAYHIQ